MAFDKAVDSTALNAGLTKIADAIRAKGGTEGTMAFPDGFAEMIEAIQAGGGGINATAGTVTVASDSNDYIVTHGLGEVPKFFVIGMIENYNTLSSETEILIEAYGFSDYDSQYRMAAQNSVYSPTGIFANSKITSSAYKRASLCDADENIIIVAPLAASPHPLIAGATYYWIAVGSGVFT